MLTENLDALSAVDKALLIILQVKVLMIGGVVLFSIPWS
jgi:hypothetical protein